MTILLSMLLSASGLCQNTGSSGKGKKDRISGNIKFMPIPYLNYGRVPGFQAGFIPAILFNPVKKDTLSPSSMAGAAGIYSQNKTWLLMAFSKFYFDEDNWRISLGGGFGSMNYQYFLDEPINQWIPYNTSMDFFFTQVQRRIINKIYGGVSFVYMNLKTTTDEFPIESNTELKGLGLDVSIDRRSSIRYPRSGFLSKIKYFTYPGFLGNDKASNKIQMEYNFYLPGRKNIDVIAGRVFIGLGLGNLSFNQQFIVGRGDIRGYSQGAYRGNYLVAAQGEYRWNFFKRFGAVGFAGLATIFKAINENDNGKLLPGAGLGIRYTIDTETNLNIGSDIAAGIDDWSINFRIGEAF